MSFQKNLSYFISNNYHSCLNFSDMINMENSQLHKYLKGKHSPSIEILKKFFDAGVSIDWLISGNVSMFADNKKGKELKIEYEKQYQDQSIKEIKARIKKWISDNFNSIDVFIEKHDISPEKLIEELEGTTLPAPEFMLFLSKAGCNIDWVMNGKVKELPNKDEDFVIQTKKKIFSNNGNDMQMELFLMQIEERVKKIMIDVIDNNDRD